MATYGINTYVYVEPPHHCTLTAVCCTGATSRDPPGTYMRRSPLGHDGQHLLGAKRLAIPRVGFESPRARSGQRVLVVSKAGPSVVSWLGEWEEGARLRGPAASPLIIGILFVIDARLGVRVRARVQGEAESVGMRVGGSVWPWKRRRAPAASSARHHIHVYSIRMLRTHLPPRVHRMGHVRVR